MAKLFLTDYGSYNEGTQFEFGHWMDLDGYSSYEEVKEYIDKHFKECDLKRPLECGTPRESVMFTGYEDMPKEFYSETMNEEEFECLFFYLELDENDKSSFEYVLWNTSDMESARDSYQDVYLHRYSGNHQSNYLETEEGDTLYSICSDLFPTQCALSEEHDFLIFNIDSIYRNHLNDFTDSNKRRFLVLSD